MTLLLLCESSAKLTEYSESRTKTSSKKSCSGCPICTKNNTIYEKRWLHNGVKISPNEFETRSKANHPTIKLKSPFRGFDRKLVAYSTISNSLVHIAQPRILLQKDSEPCPVLRGAKNNLTTEQFIQKASALHDGRYTYENSVYESARKPVIVTCAIHGDFVISRASDHYANGSGCPRCGSPGGFKTTLPGTVYYIEINKGEAYKIGITNRTVQARFPSRDLKKIKILKTWYYEDGNLAREHEKYVIDLYKPFKYEGTSPLKSCKTSELFARDISKYPDFIPTIALNNR
jgi:hypothetical protein